MDTQSGISFVYITNPEVPVVLGFSCYSVPSNWFDMKVYKDHVFIMIEDNPLML